MLKKGLIFGMVVLFLCMSIVSPVSSNSIREECSLKPWTGSDGIEIIGTMGENGWYTSPVTVILYFHNHTYFKIDDGDWIEYITPIIVIGDGPHTVYCFYIDDEGNMSEIYSISFKIDATPPVVSLTVTPMNLLRTKWAVSVTAEDATSGVTVVELYVEYELVCSMTTPPYEFGYQGKGHSIQALVYDCAGNAGESDIIPLPLLSQQSKSQQIIQPYCKQNTQLTHNLMNNLIIQCKTFSKAFSKL